jgi:hypothetical protein
MAAVAFTTHTTTDDSQPTQNGLHAPGEPERGLGRPRTFGDLPGLPELDRRAPGCCPTRPSGAGDLHERSCCAGSGNLRDRREPIQP